MKLLQIWKSYPLRELVEMEKTRMTIILPKIRAMKMTTSPPIRMMAKMTKNRIPLRTTKPSLPSKT